MGVEYNVSRRFKLGLGFGIGIPVGMLLGASAYLLADASVDPGVPGVAARLPTPTPEPTPVINYGVDPLGDDCARDKNAESRDVGIKFSESPIRIGGYDVTAEEGELFTVHNDKIIRGKELFLPVAQGKPTAREYTLKIGEVQYLDGPTDTIKAFLERPKVYSSLVTGKCTVPE